MVLAEVAGIVQGEVQLIVVCAGGITRQVRGVAIGDRRTGMAGRAYTVYWRVEVITATAAIGK